MITQGLLFVLYAFLFVVTSPLRLAADVTSNSTIVSSIVTANGYLNSIPFAYTLASILGALAVLTAFEVAYYGYKIIRWVYQKIPGIT